MAAKINYRQSLFFKDSKGRMKNQECCKLSFASTAWGVQPGRTNYTYFATAFWDFLHALYYPKKTNNCSQSVVKLWGDPNESDSPHCNFYMKNLWLACFPTCLYLPQTDSEIQLTVHFCTMEPRGLLSHSSTRNSSVTSLVSPKIVSEPRL